MLLATAVALLLSAGLALHEFRRMREAHAQLAAHQALRTSLLREHPRAQVAGRQIPATAPSSQVPDAALADLFQKAKKGPGGVPLIWPEALFASHPELSVKYLEAAAARTRELFAPFLATEGFTPDQVRQFLALYEQREKAWADLQADATIHGKADTDPAIKAQNDDAISQREQALTGLLGPGAYQRLVEYRASLEARIGLLGLNTLVGATFDTAEPMEIGKMNQLATLVTKANLYHADNAAPPPDAAAFAAVRKEARGILTAGQMEIFDLLLDHQQVTMAKRLNHLTTTH